MNTKILPQEPLIKNLLFTGAGVLLAGIIIIFVFWTKLPPQIPLYFSRPWGEEQLAKPIFVFLPLALSFVFLLLNLIFARLAAGNDFLKKVLILGATATAVLATITIIRIIFLVV